MPIDKITVIPIKGEFLRINWAPRFDKIKVMVNDKEFTFTESDKEPDGFHIGIEFEPRTVTVNAYNKEGTMVATGVAEIPVPEISITWHIEPAAKIPLFQRLIKKKGNEEKVVIHVDEFTNAFEGYLYYVYRGLYYPLQEVGQALTRELPIKYSERSGLSLVLVQGTTIIPCKKVE